MARIGMLLSVLVTVVLTVTHTRAQFLAKNPQNAVDDQRIIYAASRYHESHEDLKLLWNSSVAFGIYDFFTYTSAPVDGAFVGVSGTQLPIVEVDPNEIDNTNSSIGFSHACSVTQEIIDPKVLVHFDSQVVSPADTMMLTLYIKPISFENEQNAVFVRVADRESEVYRLDVYLSFIHLNQWHKIDLPLKFTDVSNYNIEISMENNSGFKQELLIGGVQITDYFSLEYEKTPFTQLYYDGMEEDAAWRAEAEVSIAVNRKAQFNIHLVDKFGNPVGMKDVQIEQRRHEFTHGARLNDADFCCDEGLFNALMVMHSHMFNMGILDKALTWQGMEDPQYDRFVNEVSRRWSAYKKRSRGYSVHWPTLVHTPEWVVQEVVRLYFGGDTAGASAFLREATMNRTRTAVRDTQEFVNEWDLIHNLPDGFSYFGYDGEDGLLSEDVQIEWLGALIAEDTSLKTSVSDSKIISELKFDSPSVRSRIEKYHSFFSRVRNSGRSVTSLALEADMKGLFSINNMRNRFNQLADDFSDFRHLKLELTEFELPCFDQTTHANYIKDLLTLIFANPKFSGFSVGQWMQAPFFEVLGTQFQRVHMGHGPMYESGKVLKEFFTYYHWMAPTNMTSTTDGLLSVDAYFGDFRVTVDGIPREITLGSYLPRDITLQV